MYELYMTCLYSNKCTQSQKRFLRSMERKYGELYSISDDPDMKYLDEDDRIEMELPPKQRINIKLNGL